MISVIIRVKNEIKTLPALIESLKKQSYHDFELVIVDNESTDGTYEYSKTHANKVVTIPKKKFSHAYSTNLGITHAAGEYVYITNGHSLPKSDNLLSIGKTILDAHADIVGLYGRNYPYKETKRANMIEQLYSLYDTMFFPPTYNVYQTYKLGMLQTTSCMIRREVLSKNPYKELKTKGGEDVLWAKERLKEGWQIAYHPDLDVFHSHGGSNWSALKRIAQYATMELETRLKIV